MRYLYNFKKEKNNENDNKIIQSWFGFSLGFQLL